MSAAAASTFITFLSHVGSEAGSHASGGAMRSFEVLSNRIFSYDIPEPNACVSAWLLGYMPDENIANQMANNGIRWQPLNPAEFRYTFIGPNQVLRQNDTFATHDMFDNQKTIVNELEYPSIDEAIVMKRRGLIDDGLFNFIVTMRMSGETNWVLPYTDLINEIPGPSDLIRFALRDAYTPSIVEGYDEAKELPKAVLPWMLKQGLGGDIGIRRPDNATYDDGSQATGNAKWFDLYWWSHWELPSISQAFEMLFRLYPTSDYGPSPDFNPAIPFTLTDVNRLLRANGQSPYFRERLTQVAYNPYTRVDIRRLYNSGILDDAGVYHAYRAIGYDDKRAKELLAFTKQLKVEKDSKKKILRNNGWICKHYAAGVLSEKEARDLLKTNGLSGDEIDYFVKTCQIEERTKVVGQTTKDVRTAYLAGRITDWQANQMLEATGLQPFKRDQLVRTWQVHLQLVKKQLSAKDNIDFYLQGIISDNELIHRLQNLTFDATDITLMMTQARRKKISNEVANKVKSDKETLAAIEKQQKAKEKAVKDKVKSVEDDYKKRLKGLLSASTDKNLMAWYKKGLISKDEVRERLAAKDWRVNDIERWIETNIPDESGDNADGSQT